MKLKLASNTNKRAETAKPNLYGLPTASGNCLTAKNVASSLLWLSGSPLESSLGVAQPENHFRLHAPGHPAEISGRGGPPPRAAFGYVETQELPSTAPGHGTCLQLPLSCQGAGAPGSKTQVIPGTIARMTAWKRSATNGVYGATRLLSLRQAILSKARCCQQSAPYLYPSAELARAINWPVAFFQGN